MKTIQMTNEEQEAKASPGSTERLLYQIKRKTRKRFSAEDKIRIVLEGFRRELPVTDLCRKEGLPTTLYYSWLKDFMEAGKSQLKKDNLRSATENEVRSLKTENQRLKMLAGELALQLDIFKKSLLS